MDSSLFTIKFVLREGVIYEISLENSGKTLYFRCSYRLLPLSLKKIANSFELEEKLPFPYKFVNEDNLCYLGPLPGVEFFNDENDYHRLRKIINEGVFDLKKYTIKYCTRDVLITEMFVKKFNIIMQKYSISSLRALSAPSIAMRIFFNKFNKKRAKMIHNETIDKFVRPSYFGGRCEVFGNPVEGEHVYHKDIVGMYAQCMREKFPFGSYTISSPSHIDQKGFYLIEGTQESTIPVLPHHRISDGKLMFTNGWIEGWYYGEEILYALQHGLAIKEIKIAITFEKYDYIFDEYVESFTILRERGGAHKDLGKLMINSLYGRLGMQKQRTDFFIAKKEDFLNFNFNNQKIKSFIALNDLCLYEKEIAQDVHKSHKSNIALASAITAKGRVRLHKMCLEAIELGGRLLYVDTDSVFAAYKNQILISDFWELEKIDTKIKNAVFTSPKSYALTYLETGGEITKLKGYNEKNISFKELRDSFYEEKDIIISDLRQINKAEFQLSQVSRKKIFNSNLYDKRKFTHNKSQTTPFLRIKNDEYL